MNVMNNVNGEREKMEGEKSWEKGGRRGSIMRNGCMDEWMDGWRGIWRERMLWPIIALYYFWFCCQSVCKGTRLRLV